jgi:hypothetical protein
MKYGGSPSVSQENRVETMARKLAVYAERAGAAPDLIVDAYTAAVSLRIAALQDVFHREMLHPARTVLIMLEDTDCRSPSVLAAAALTETEFPELRIASDVIRAHFGTAVSDTARLVPQPHEWGEELAEQLVIANDDVALIAVAERLDHARHLHFRDSSLWRPFFLQIMDTYLPFSERVNPILARRLSRWAGAFEARFLS